MIDTLDFLFVLNTLESVQWLALNSQLHNRSKILFWGQKYQPSAVLQSQIDFIWTGDRVTDLKILQGYIDNLKPNWVCCDFDWSRLVVEGGIVYLRQNANPLDLDTYLKHCRAWIPTHQKAEAIVKSYPILSYNRLNNIQELSASCQSLLTQAKALGADLTALNLLNARLKTLLLLPEGDLNQHLTRPVSAYPNIHLHQTSVFRQATPRISVIVPCYNYAQFLRECVESVLRQTYKDFEIIIVNDGSPDHTSEVCQQLLSDYPEAAIQVIEQSNSGDPAVARNQGIDLAKGEWILCLDADDWINLNFLQACMNTLEQNPHLGILYPRLHETGASQALWNPIPYDVLLLSRLNIIPTASLFRKSDWRRLGGIKTGVIIAEDWDFWLSCLRAEIFGQQVADAILYHRVHPDGSLLDSFGQTRKRNQVKAEIILRRPELYTHMQKNWACSVIFEGEAPPQKVDISWMPYSSHEAVPLQLEQLDQKHLKLLTEENLWRLIRQRSPFHAYHQSWSVRCKQWVQEICINSFTDWHPENPSPPQINSPVWVPTKVALDFFKEKYPDTNTVILPRFAHLIAPPNSSEKLSSKGFQVLAILELEQSAQWQSFLATCQKHFRESDDLALILFFRDAQAEKVFEILSDWLETHSKDKESGAELVILDQRDYTSANLLHLIQPDVVYCSPHQDASGAFWLSAMSQQIPILLEGDIPPEYQTFLKKGTPPVILTQLLQDLSEYQLCNAEANFVSIWNQHILQMMANQIKCDKNQSDSGSTV